MQSSRGATLQTTEGAYRIHESVAVGGFASVYYGRDLRTNVPVAVKMLHPQHATNERVVRHFVNEAALARELHHPNLVRILDQGQAEDGQLFIVMEWMTGWTIGQLIAQRGAFPLDEAATIVSQALAGLGAAHARRIYHRDIKPANLMVTADRVVKVMDFGISKDASLAAVSGGSSVMGTPAYMAPEQFRGEPADARTDLYAMGITLYQMLAGRMPFESDTSHGYMYKHLQEAPPPIRVLRADLPPTLDAAILKALAKSPDERFQTAGEMASALAPFASGTVTMPLHLPDGARVGAPMTPPPTTPPGQAWAVPPAAPPPATPPGQAWAVPPDAPPPPSPARGAPATPPPAQFWAGASTPPPAPPGQPTAFQPPPPGVQAPLPQPTVQAQTVEAPAGSAVYGWSATPAHGGTPPSDPGTDAGRRGLSRAALVSLVAVGVVTLGVVLGAIGLVIGRGGAGSPPATPAAAAVPTSAPPPTTGPAAGVPRAVPTAGPVGTQVAVPAKPAGPDCSSGLNAAAAQRQRRSFAESAATLEGLKAGGCDVANPLYDAYVALAREHADAERMDEAIARYDQALALKAGGEAQAGRDLAAAYREGVIALNRQETDAAIASLEKVHTASPRLAQTPKHLAAAYTQKGDALEARREYSPAIEQYERARSLTPDDPSHQQRIDRVRQAAMPTATPAPPPPTAAARPTSTPTPRPDPSIAVRQAIRSYYLAVHERRFADAYRFWNRASQAQMAFDAYQRQYDDLRSLSLRSIEVTGVSGSSATVVTRTETVRLRDGRPLTNCWKTDIQLVFEDGNWRRASANQVEERC